MKKFVILLTIFAFISACSDSDLGDHHGTFSADVSGKKHDSEGPYLMGDNNSLTARLASCSTSWSNGATDSISTDLSHSVATDKVTMTVTIHADNVTSHSITVNIDDFMNRSDAMEEWLCDWIRDSQHSDQIGNKFIW